MTRSPVDGRLGRGTLPDIVNTERLQLRPWSLGDVDEVFAYARDPKWSRFLHLVPVPYGRRDAEIFIARQLERHPDINRVRGYADARNTASQRVMEKLGMTREGVLRANRLERGEMMDEAWYGILRSEWERVGGSPTVL